MSYYIGVDVGTTSVRAAVIKQSDSDFKVVETSSEPIRIWNDLPDHFEQSSADIWNSVICTVKEVVSKSGITNKEVKGIGFDATCSLVVLDTKFNPIQVTPSGGSFEDSSRNVIMWMDHRATEEVRTINSSKHSLLKFVGGGVSVEMEMPKILWIKNNLAETWKRIGALMDLPDFLTYRASGCQSRSLCSLVCKWAYDASEGSMTDHCWNVDFLNQIGLGELADDKYEKLGQHVCAPGQPVGNGLSELAASELGLLAGTPVGTSLIDAHAGGIGMLICQPDCLSKDTIAVENKLGLICGTSTCHMVVSREPAYIPGVWGPYFSAMVPGMWLSEGGQSATGKLIDHMLESHPAYKNIAGDPNPYSVLSSKLSQLSNEKKIPEYCLSKDLHVYPDFHGNRSPLADPQMKGMVCGLTLNNGVNDLAIFYLATLQSLAYGTRHTVEEMEGQGHSISTVYMCGGLIKNLLYVQMTADILNKPVVVSDEPESVLVGAALLGLCAHERMPLNHVINTVSCGGTVYLPNGQSQDYHHRKYQVFRQMSQHQLCYKNIMDKA